MTRLNRGIALFAVGMLVVFSATPDTLDFIGFATDSSQWTPWARAATDVQVSFFGLSSGRATWKFKNDGKETIKYINFEWNDRDGQHYSQDPWPIKPGQVDGGWIHADSGVRPIKNFKVTLVFHEGDMAAAGPDFASTLARLQSRAEGVYKARLANPNENDNGALASSTAEGLLLSDRQNESPAPQVTLPNPVSASQSPQDASPTPQKADEPSRSAEPSPPSDQAASQTVRSRSTGIELVAVDGGQFLMGGPEKDATPHQVTVSGFLMAKDDVTQAQLQQVSGINFSKVKDPSLPASTLSWQDAVAFCNLLSRLDGLPEAYEIEEKYVYNPDHFIIWSQSYYKVRWIKASTGYRLPTESEWEWAARGGKLSHGFRYPGSDDLEEVAWVKANSNGTIHPVGQKKPNELGLFDMTGNVYQYCWDQYWDYSKDPLRVNPEGFNYSNSDHMEGTNHVLRGNTYLSQGGGTVSERNATPVGNRYPTMGFRIVRSTEAR